MLISTARHFVLDIGMRPMPWNDNSWLNSRGPVSPGLVHIDQYLPVWAWTEIFTTLIGWSGLFFLFFLKREAALRSALHGSPAPLLSLADYPFYSQPLVQCHQTTCCCRPAWSPSNFLPPLLPLLLPLLLPWHAVCSYVRLKCYCLANYRPVQQLKCITF